MRNLFLLAIVICSIPAAAQACKPMYEHRKLNQSSVQATQRDKVNSGKELWRLDAKEVAKRECDALPKLRSTSGPIAIRGDDKTQSFACGPLQDAHYELTLKRPEWLLPYAGIYKMMMWVVTDVKTTCARK